MYRHIDSKEAFDVSLNGKPVVDVVSADDTSGKVIIYAHDRNGNRIPRSEADHQREIYVHNGYEVVHCQGEVVIEIKEKQETMPFADQFKPEWGCY